MSLPGFRTYLIKRKFIYSIDEKLDLRTWTDLRTNISEHETAFSSFITTCLLMNFKVFKML